MGRRRFLGLGSLAAGSLAIRSVAFGMDPSRSVGPEEGSEVLTPWRSDDGRLKSRPSPPRDLLPPGRHELGLGGDRDGVLFIPGGRRPETPVPLVLMLHGAGGSAAGGVRPFEALAERHGLILLAPDSRGTTWDLVRGRFGPDVEFIDRALKSVFSRCAIDRGRISVEGFSDGASYALALGLTNGDLFGKVVAFSPGFMSLVKSTGKPSLFVSHGTRDTVLPIEQCSRRIVPRLREAGYAVRYEEFEGGHTVPVAQAEAAAAWVAKAG